jgi:antitoxin ParD1/3/4
MTNTDKPDEDTSLLDDLSWAKPYVDEALAAVGRGEVMTLEEHKRRIAAQLAAMRT